MGGAYQDGGLVCAQPDGSPVKPDALTHAFESIVKRAKVKRARLHDLRHTHATILLRQGIHPKVVSERLGHASVVLTLQTYSHILPDMQEEAAASVDRVLNAAITAAG